AWLAVGRETTTVGVVLQAVTLPPLLRIDAAGFAAGVVLLAAAGVLVTVRRPGTAVSALGALATACAVLALEAGSVALLAVAVGAACLLLVAAHREEGGRLDGGLWAALVLATLALLVAAADVLANAGTTAYAAVPVTAFSTRAFLLVVFAALCLTGLLPWPTWVSASLRRSRAEATGVTLVLLTPLGLFLLLETTQLGAGTWPLWWLHGVVAGWSAVTLVAAGLRAQAATGRRQVLRELALMQVAMAAIALCLGTRFGIVAGVTGLAAATLSQLTSLLLPTDGRLGLLGFALTVGVPPGWAFGALALTAEASLEIGAVAQLLVLVLGVAWVFGIAAAVRAARLPVGTDRSRWGGMLVSVLGLAGGALLGPFEIAIALPVAALVVPATNLPPPITVINGALLATTGGWGALALGALAIASVAVLPLVTKTFHPAAPREPVPALVAAPAPTPLDGLHRVARRLRLRAPGWDRALQRMQIASERGPIWLWAAIAFVLAIVVTR
ncbi:MAG: hypothetical protein ACREQM_22290, partial [Candidatus Dormibacteraceae bacterium]